MTCGWSALWLRTCGWSDLWLVGVVVTDVWLVGRGCGYRRMVGWSGCDYGRVTAVMELNKCTYKVYL